MNGLEMRRRAMMGRVDICPYSKDGLILWLDGKDQGNIAGAWVDRIGGEVFTAVSFVQFNNDHVYLTGGGYLSNTSFANPNISNATIEIAVSGLYTSRINVVYMPKAEAFNAIAVGNYRGSIIWANKGRKSIIDIPNGCKLISITGNSKNIIDGVPCSYSSGDYWDSANSLNYIGKRCGGNAFSGAIYSLRIYNRNLTADEMLENQRVDNQRFGLGLNV